MGLLIKAEYIVCVQFAVRRNCHIF